jgi:hypothetical protein
MRTDMRNSEYKMTTRPFTVCIILLGLALLLSGDLVPAQAGTVPLTRLASSLVDTRIAFVAFPSGNPEIYVVNADGAGQQNLTNHPGLDFSPAWSPDGARIAFESNRDGDYEIYVMNADGTGLLKLTDNSTADEDPVWSPEGKRIAFNSASGLCLINSDGTGLSCPPGYPAASALTWSPDGGKLAFVSSRDGNNEIYSMNVDGTAQTNLTQNPAHDYEPEWSPDGTRIAFVSERDGNREIYSMNPDGSGQTNLTQTSWGEHWLTWSPDSTKIAFTSYVTWPAPIFVMNADGTGQTQLTTPSSNHYEPAWSTYPSIPLFLQKSQPWSDDLLGETWIVDPTSTVGKWGCLMTSAAMIVEHLTAKQQPASHVDPGQFNTWLRAQRGGYAGRHLVWSMIGKYAEEFGVGLSAPEFINEKDDNALDSALASGKYAILHVNNDGHWVVAIEKTLYGGQPTYLINDPIYGRTTLLERYGGDYSRIILYSATRGTLLSISAHSPVELLVTDPQGRKSGYDPIGGVTWAEIPGAYYFVNTLAPDGGSGLDLDAVHSKDMVIASPLDGDYSVEILGIDNGDYQVYATSLNLSGLIMQSSMSGTADSGSRDDMTVWYSSYTIFMPFVSR